MKWHYLVLLVVLLALPVVYAIDLNQEVSAADQASFDQMLQPVIKIYNLVKYVASFIAALCLLFAGITYMTSGDDPKKRDQAKNMASYVIIGLIIIWAAPLIVNFLT